VLFDMDGLLVDSEPVWYDVETEIVEQLGGTWSHEHQAQCIGGTIRSTAQYIRDLTGTDRPVEALMADALAAMRERFVAGVPTLPGALECVDAVRAAGVPTALVTSTYRSLADAALTGLGSHRFDVTVAGDEVPAGKPDPAPYRLACERLGVEPAACVVLEDSVSGVRSGLAAGCFVVAVPTAAGITGGPRCAVLDTLAGIDVEWLLELPVRAAA
jgi:HAD superfamily hydrolase (TIGR01509 family)